MKKVEFDNYDLTEKAFEVYSDSSFVFYKKGNTYFYADSYGEKPTELGGGIEKVEEFLLEFAE